MAQDQILEFFGKLNEKPPTTIRFFERSKSQFLSELSCCDMLTLNFEEKKKKFISDLISRIKEYYTVYGEDAVFLARELFKTVSLLKSTENGSEKIHYLHLSRSNFEFVIKNLLFERQYRIEIYQNQGTGRSSDWNLCCKASPGNLSQLEEILYGAEDSYTPDSKGIIAIKLLCNGNEMQVGIAFCDALLREFHVCEFKDNNDLTSLEPVLVQLSPTECLLSSCTDQTVYQVAKNIIKMNNILPTECKSGDFSAKDIVQDLNRLIKLEEGCNFLNTLPDESEMKIALSGVAAIIKHLELLSDDSNFGQFNMSILRPKMFAKIDIHTVRGLSLFPISTKGKKRTLVGLLNKCRTAPGERLLGQWIRQPLMDTNKINERLDIVECLISDVEMRVTLHDNYLRRVPDLQMLLRKIKRQKASLKDLYKIYQVVLKLPYLLQCLEKHDGPRKLVLKANFCDDLKERIGDLKGFIDMIVATMDLKAVEDREFIISAECDEKLTELKSEMEKLKSLIMKQMDKASDDLGLVPHKSLKIEYCSQIGYHFRVTKKEERALRNNKKYITIDTKASGIRFRDLTMKERSEQYMEYIRSYENTQKAIVVQLMEVAASYDVPLKLLCDTISRLDVYVSLSCVSVSAPKPYVRPEIIEKGQGDIILKQARHPFLELHPNIDYIPNDVEFIKDQANFFFITGPNMGGKSTFIKSVALNVLLAQIGCFVPCDEAKITVVDAILTRVGANDMPSKGISTFMAEMIEMKKILSTATSDSLLIIDEMGRGTSTFDGYGLCWSISEHIAGVLKSSCLFATHFHELTEMSKEMPNVHNLQATALITGDAITFLYRIKPGICQKSYGINVCEMVNFPKSVTEHAKEKCKELELGDYSYKDVIEVFASAPNGEVFLSALKYICPKEVADVLGDKFSDLPALTANQFNLVVQNLEKILQEK